MEKNSEPVAPTEAAEVAARIEEIKKVWSQAAGNSIELARVIWDARRQLPYGQWEQLLRLLPFSKRKANMLAAIGKRFTWLDGQTFAQLPTGWSILYQLAQLDRVTFERLIQEGAIHPGLRFQEARTLLAQFKGQSNKKKSRRTHLKQRLQRFGDFIRGAVLDWQPEERDLAERELTRLLELVRGGDGDGFERHVGNDRTGHRADQRVFTTDRTATLHSPQQSETML